MEPKLIKNWAELSECTSSTHTLDINVKDGSGWIYPKNAGDDAWEDSWYLSTHTFYGHNYKQSTRLLQSCGFNVTLASWDKPEE